MSRIKWTRIIAVVLVLITVAGIFSACSKKNEQEEKQETKKLSEMSDEELLQRLEDEGVSVPKSFSAEDIREMIIDFEKGSDQHLYAYSAPHLVEFVEELRTFVKEYYDVTS